MLEITRGYVPTLPTQRHHTHPLLIIIIFYPHVNLKLTPSRPTLFFLIKPLLLYSLTTG